MDRHPPCATCGGGYYRTSTRTTNEKIYYYRCLSSDDYRYEGGHVCTGAWNRPAPQTQPATNAPDWKPVPLRMRCSNGCCCPGSRRA